MRNYIRAHSATVLGNDGFVDQRLVYFGQTDELAFDFANVTAQQLVAGGWSQANAFINPPLNVLLGAGFVSSLLIFPQQGSQPTGGFYGRDLFDSQVSLDRQLGLDPFVSPKFQDVYPWNGRAKRHFIFKGFPHLR